MKIKGKLLLGIGLLFGMVLLLTVVSTLFVNKLSGDTRNILAANYNTLDYSRQMIIALSKGIRDAHQQELFVSNLVRQQHNVTEPGEKESTDRLTRDFDRLLGSPDNDSLLHSVRTDITDIMLLNMRAIQRKSAVAEATADQSIFWISVIGTICFLIALVLLFNLPGNIANPIGELTESIKQIAAQDYSRRIQFNKRNEFGDLASAFNTMAEKLEEYQAGNLEKLMVEKKRIETLINNMTDPVIGLDEAHRVLFINNIGLKIAGLDADGTLGRPVQDIAMKNDLIRSLVHDLFDPVPPERGPAPMKIYADNKESYFEKEIIPIKIIRTGEKEEKLIGNVILLQNVTRYKELDFAKTNFIATVSHELKTPISSIRMSLQLLENKQIGELNAEQRGLLDSIGDDAGRLLKITAELLNMTQVESGRIQLSAMPADAREIMDYAINANRSAAEQKHIALDALFPTELPQVLCDSEKTAWVLTNLVSNAVRYSHDDASVKLSIAVYGSMIQFSVSDNGQGIEPQYIGRIFDRYFRIPGTRKEGTGLGLAISKEFIEAQRGTISVTSELGSGSTFIVRLPIAGTTQTA